jgi:hypothetical protein
MSIKRSDENLFLKSPDIFDIVYYRGGGGEGGDKPHKALNKFKSCALQACTVDYTPLGSYMTFSDEAGTMVSYTITMQFQEIDPIYDNDYENFDSDVIGY